MPSLAPARALLASGLPLGIAVVGAGAPLQSRAERQLLGRWLTTAVWPWEATGLHLAPHAALVALVAVMTVVWLLVAWLIASGRVPDRLVLLGVAAWTAPFALAPPFLSRDAYAYLAQGELVRRGIDPYLHGATSLGSPSAALAAVDPVWRHTPAPYGPVALRVEELLGGGLVGLVLLRLVVLGCLVGVLIVVRRSLPAERRPLATWLVCSPLVLLQLVAALHLDGLLCLLLVGAAALAARGRLRSAAALAGVAVDVKATALVLVLVLVVIAFQRHGLRPAVRLGGWAMGSAAVGCLAYPADPVGWVRALSTPTAVWDPFTPSSTAYLLLSETWVHLGVGLAPWVATGCRVVALGAGAVLGLVLLRRAEAHGTAAAAGLLLLVVMLFGPVLWPWYLAPCVLLLVLAGQTVLPAVLGAAAALVALPLPVVDSQRVGLAAEVLGLALLLVVARGPVWRRAWGGRRAAADSLVTCDRPR